MSRLRGRSRITQQGEEICRVNYDLAEFLLFEAGSAPYSEFEGTIELAGGIPLNTGLPNLVLELADSRRVALEITGLRQLDRGEVYEVQAQPVFPDNPPRGYPSTSRPGS